MTKKEITNIYGEKNEIACLSCAIQSGEVEPPGGVIASSEHFEAHQDYEIPIPGFIILVSKRHLASIDEFTEDEQVDFIQFLCHIRKGMREALEVDTVYFVQEEDTQHHFHVWMFPRYDWMTEEKFGRKINSLRPIMEYARKHMKTEGDLAKVDKATQKLMQFLTHKE